MILAAVVSSIDLLAVTPQIPNATYPYMHNLILGQGLWCDAAAVTLIITTEKLWIINRKVELRYDEYYAAKDTIGATKYMYMVPANFFKNLSFAFLMGAAFGLVMCLTLKHIRAISHSPAAETLIIFTGMMSGYSLADWSIGAGMGVPTIITQGIFMSTYGYYSLSSQGKLLSSQTLKFLGYFAEATVFVFIGLSLFNVNNTAWSWQLTIWIFVIVNVTRVIVIVPSYYLMTCCSKKDFSFKEIMFICITGNIKGAICFGLLVEMSEFGVWCNLTT
jgi:NhaP-type Na+/H+ or K+/H+ antiporter